MKTAEQIAQGHSLSTCRNCDCAMNGGVCKRIEKIIWEAKDAGSTFGLLQFADFLDTNPDQQIRSGDLASALRKVLQPAP